MLKQNHHQCTEVEAIYVCNKIQILSSQQFRSVLPYSSEVLSPTFCTLQHLHSLIQAADFGCLSDAWSDAKGLSCCHLMVRTHSNCVTRWKFYLITLKHDRPVGHPTKPNTWSGSVTLSASQEGDIWNHWCSCFSWDVFSQKWPVEKKKPSYIRFVSGNHSWHVCSNIFFLYFIRGTLQQP